MRELANPGQTVYLRPGPGADMVTIFMKILNSTTFESYFNEPGLFALY